MGKYETVEELVKARTKEEKAFYHFDFKNGIEMIRNAVDEKEPITIVGDYDVDGISASAIMYLTLKELGAEPKIRIPLRFSEGYGMSPKIIDEIDSGLVITVDNGISCFDAIRDAKNKNLTVLVTDHHLPAVNDKGEMVFPNADCIIDPHIEELRGEEGYDCFAYCGAGIALKIAEQLIPDNTELLNKLYSIAAIATVADSVPMVGENKEIVKSGIKQIVDGKTTDGIQELFRQNKINLEGLSTAVEPHNLITADILGYRIGPCINAASRVVEGGGTGKFEHIREGGDGARISLDCILADNESTAQEYAGYLLAYNEHRKTMTQKGCDEADEYIRKNEMQDDCPLVVYAPDIRPGIIGIVAGRLSETYGKPAIVISGTGKCHGSCRAPEGYHMKDLLDHANNHLAAYGGHAGAAGITVMERDIDTFRAEIQTVCKKMYPGKLIDDSIQYDLEISILDINSALTEISTKLSPFGEENPEPVFYIRDFFYDSARVLVSPASGTKHLKITDGIISAMMFNCEDADRIKEKLDETMSGDEVPIIGTISYNCFRGNLTPQIFIKKLLIEE